MSYSLREERGQGRLKLIVALLITAGVLFAAWHIVPIYIQRYEFQDAVREEAKFAPIRNAEPSVVRERLFRKAQELGLPIKPEQIVVTPAGEGVRISVRYSVPVQLGGYALTLDFQTSADTATAY